MPVNPPWVMNSSLLTIQGMSASLETVFPMGSPPVGGFLPSSLTGLVAWYDASRIAGISSGQSLSAWTDLSGQANHVTQASAASQPVFVTNTLNSKPTVQFNGGQTLGGGDLDLPTGGYTTIAVSSWSLAPAAVHYMILAKQTAAAGEQYSLKFRNSPNGNAFIQYYTGAVQVLLFGTIAESANSFAAHMASWDGTNHILYRNAVSTNTSVTTSTFGAQNNDNIAIGGSTDINANFLKGAIAEVALYNRSLSASEISSMGNYLVSKWGL